MSGRNFSSTIISALGLLLLSCTSALQAQTIADPAVSASIQKIEDNNDNLQININVIQVLLTAFLVFFMQAGFVLVETGFTRARNVVNTIKTGK
jgi:hypothetical protein